VTPDDLSPADRELAQAAMTRIYLGRLQRLEWDRQFVRDRVTGLVRPRIYALKKFERLPGGRRLEALDQDPSKESV
jgi:hypothetical protein